MSRAVKLTNETQFLLPPGIMGRSDVARLLREIEKVDYDFESQTVRNPGKPLTIPAMSRSLSELITLNQVTIESLESRQGLVANMRKVKDKAPSVHVTFAVDPSPEIIRELIGWVRQNLHPVALVSIGLQPGIIGGCVVRTPDHIYDFTLRNRFKQALPELSAAVRALQSV
jgi:hypothetical protein